MLEEFLKKKFKEAQNYLRTNGIVDQQSNFLKILKKLLRDNAHATTFAPDALWL